MGFPFLTRLLRCVQSAWRQAAPDTQTRSPVSSLTNTELEVPPDLENAVREALGTHASMMLNGVRMMCVQTLIMMNIDAKAHTGDDKMQVVGSKWDDNVAMCLFGDGSAIRITFDTGTVLGFDKEEEVKKHNG